MRGSGTYHHLRQRVLRIERSLDPHGPRFENAGLWKKGGGEVQLRGVVTRKMHMLRQSAR